MGYTQPELKGLLGLRKRRQARVQAEIDAVYAQYPSNRAGRRAAQRVLRHRGLVQK